MGDSSSGKTRVCVVMGGRTAEHDISLETGTVIVQNLPRERYDVKPVVIAKSGLWHVPPGYLGPGENWAPDEATLPSPQRLGTALDRLLDDGVEAAFLAMHGPFGEDGTIQGLFEMVDLPYTGSDVYGSSLCMDKPRVKEILTLHGIPTPRFVCVDEFAWARDPKGCCRRIETELGLPVIFKPPRLGSSVGTRIVREASKLPEGFAATLAYDRRALIEALVKGREITCAVLGAAPGEAPTPLPLVEVAPRTAEFFDYRAKYTPGATEEICPARIDEAVTRRAQDLAVRIHGLVGCGGLSRTDMIVDGESLNVLEVNTIPGMTKNSLYPQAARAIGMDFPTLLSRLVDLALAQHRTRRACLDHDALGA